MQLSGNLREFSLVDLLQLIALTKKTGGLNIRGEEAGVPLDAWIFVREGQVIGARKGSLSGTEALYSLFLLEAGEFTFFEDVVLPEPEIDEPTETLIFRGIQWAEEAREKLARLPSLQAIPRLNPDPPAGADRISLAPEEWQLLTGVDGRSTLGRLARQLELDPLKIREAAAQLRSYGLITFEGEEAGPEGTGQVDASELFSLLHGELEERLRASGRVLLRDAFQKAGLDPRGQEPVPFERAEQVCAYLERATALLIGRKRARALCQDLMARVKKRYGEEAG